MRVDDFDTFAQPLVTLGEIFDIDLSPGRQVLYFEALRDLELPLVIGALTAAARECKFFPKPVELRTLAVGDDADHSEKAWHTWQAMAARFGAYRSLMCDDGALADTLIAVFGSWPSACAYDESPEMWVAKRKEFDRVYRLMRSRGMQGPRRLVGICEHDNLGKGFAVDEEGMPLLNARGEFVLLDEHKPAAALPPAPQQVE